MSYASKLFLAVSLGVCTGCTTAFAEIVKTANFGCENRLCLYWWPRLPSLQGWHPDENVNRHVRINALIPDGFTWQNADTIMYARAVYKPDCPNLKSLESFIADDRKSFVEKPQSAVINEAPPTITREGDKLRSLTYFRPGAKNWERVSYGEEGDYYLLFVISARSEAGYRHGQTAYEKLIREYKR